MWFIQDSDLFRVQFINFAEDHAINIPTKFVSKRPSGFREENKIQKFTDDDDGHQVMTISHMTQWGEHYVKMCNMVYD